MPNQFCLFNINQYLFLQLFLFHVTSNSYDLVHTPFTWWLSVYCHCLYRTVCVGVRCAHSGVCAIFILPTIQTGTYHFRRLPS